jgi:hypothetical protein
VVAGALANETPARARIKLKAKKIFFINSMFRIN